MAKIFRLQENTPDVYSHKSRDFQLLCNVFDVLNGGVKHDIDTIPQILDTQLCNDKLLPLLQTKLGFFSNRSFTSTELRIILSAFKQMVRDKGSILGIREAIEIYLKIIDAKTHYKINFVNKEKDNDLILNSYIITVSLEGQLSQLSTLSELLKYVLPAGYKIKYELYRDISKVTKVTTDNCVTIQFITDDINDSVSPYSSDSTSLRSRVSTSRTVQHPKEEENE